MHSNTIYIYTLLHTHAQKYTYMTYSHTLHIYYYDILENAMSGL